MPTKNRGVQAARCVERILETTVGINIELIVIAHPEPMAQLAFQELSKNPLVNIQWKDCTVMEAYKIGGLLSKGTHFFCIDDDAWPSDNWLAEALEVFKRIPDGHGYVKILSDSQNYWAERAITTRKFIVDYLGGVLCIPHYISQYDDVEKSDRAILAGRFYVAEKSYIEHRHWVYGKAKKDQTYIDGGISNVTHDHNMYAFRKARGFPNDYSPYIINNE